MAKKYVARSTMKCIKEELFRWVCERHATNGNLDKDLVREKAFELTKVFGLNDFKCSNAWITVFLKEHGITVDLRNQGDPVFSNYRGWLEAMRPTIIGYKHNDLFHVDELTMYTDILPAKIPSSDKIVGSDGGNPRNRITILLGCNSSGTTKLPLLICGPYSSVTTTGDHVYRHTENCSIGDDLFRDWLSAVNDRMSRSDRKILLFLRRNRAHALRDFPTSNVNLVYFPNDFPPLLRPLRRDVFHYVKMIFRRRYAEKLNPRDVLESLIGAWESVPREIVVYSFQRTHFRTDDHVLQIDCNCWDDLKTGISFKRFVTFDDDLSDVQPPPSGKCARYHGYNLRATNGKLVEINLDDGNSTSDIVKGIKETKSEESFDESNRGYRAKSLELKNSMEQRFDSGMDWNRGRRRSLSAKNLNPLSPVSPQALITEKRRRESSATNGSGDDCSSDSVSSEKKLKTDSNWSKEFETTFVFGTSNSTNCPTTQQRDETIHSCIFNATP
ncbi:PREDICTED: tigger transposable element-derived protein 4-like [Dufourea novaeangliae]|uniref:tigger transposable element-derived protein 4-like n=1 Tax=Dufourea novaeangliae TaxID=178035 RepID=UPI0007677B02|nr:PREDICTED: tigger transposable element-derived protein 4-like [Dufourea novaeangliae]